MNVTFTIQISHGNRTLFQCSQPTELQQVVEKIEKRVRQLGYRHCSFIIKYCQHGGRCCHVAAPMLQMLQMIQFLQPGTRAI